MCALQLFHGAAWLVVAALLSPVSTVSVPCLEQTDPICSAWCQTKSCQCNARCSAAEALPSRGLASVRAFQFVNIPISGRAAIACERQYRRLAAHYAGWLLVLACSHVCTACRLARSKPQRAFRGALAAAPPPQPCEAAGHAALPSHSMPGVARLPCGCVSGSICWYARLELWICYSMLFAPAGVRHWRAARWWAPHSYHCPAFALPPGLHSWALGLVPL